ncbi:MAG: autotransporter-associated beta strand repeat-containing protein [Verrucomicrobia bacterium]|nr:autotransporter-associated beta strand repeat-containing protein [Verrucomicrobiota bacterium]
MFTRLTSLSLLLAALVIHPSAQAATITKANNTTRISDTGSWVGAVAPTSADIGLFDSTITAPLTIANLGANTTGGSLQFTTIGGNVGIGIGANASSTTYTLGLNTTYEVDMSAAAADVTIGTATAPCGFLRWATAAFGGMNVASGRTLTLNANVSNQGNNKAITMTGGGNIIFNGGAGSGVAMGFSIQGGTIVTMNGAGGWGGTSVKELINGTLNLGIDTALNGVTLTMGGTSSTTPTLAATSSARTISSGITLVAVTTGNAMIAGSQNLTVNGTLLNSGGNRILTVNNSALTTFGGAVNLSEGATARTLTINGTGNVAISGTITNGGTATSGNLIKDGASTLTLSGVNFYTGTTTINAGILKLTGGSLSNTAISFGGTATLAVQPGSTTTISAGDTIAGTAGATLNLGAQTFDMRDGFKSTFNLQQQASFATAGLTIANGATLKFDLVDAGADLLAVTKAASVSGTINVTLATNLLTTLTVGNSFNIITAASGLTTGAPTWQFTGGGTWQRITLGGTTYLLNLVATDTAVSVQVGATYSVTYDGNGSDGGTVPTDSNNPYNPSATVTVLDNTGTLTKSGYTFDGWNTQADGLGTHRLVSSTFAIAANTTLYAQWANASSSISAPATFPAGLTTTYGAASSAQSVAVTGSGLTVDITATSTNSSLEISSSGSTYGSTATISQSGGSASGTLYVRLTTNAPVSGNFNSANIILTSFGVPTVMVATTASGNTVTAKALTVDSAAAQNKLSDGTVAAVITGTLNGVTNGDTVTLSLSGTFASSAVGGPYAVTSTSTLGGAGAGNYTLTQPAGLTASIFATTAWNNPAGGFWSTTANWLNNCIATGSGQTADFSQLDITADATVNLDSARTIGNLVFGDTDTGTAASLTISNNATPANTLTLAGAAPTITVNPLGTGKSAAVAAVVAGSSGLTKAGSGTLVLSGANTYTGGTVVSNGTIVWSADNNLGASASGITLQGGTLAMSASAVTAIIDTHTITVGAAGGTIHNANTANDLILGTAGLLTGSGSLTNSGSYGLWLQAANAGFTGNLYVNGGVTEAGVATALGSSAVTVNTGGELAVDSVTLANNVTVDGGTISGNNGNATVLSGTISVGASGMTVATRNWWSPATGANMTINNAIASGIVSKTGSAGTLTLAAANTFTAITNKEGKINFNNTAAGGSGIYSENGTTNLAGSGVGSGAFSAPITVVGASANVTIQNANASGGIGSAFTGSADQTLTLDNGGGQNVNLNATTKQLQNFYGTVVVSAGSSMVDRSSTTTWANGSDNALFNVLGSVSSRNGGGWNLGALSGSGTLSMGTAGSVGIGLSYTVGARGTDATFTGVIQDGDTVNSKRVDITKTGSATQTLTGVNTYSGNTTVNAGKLALSGSGSIANTPRIGIADGATFDVSGITPSGYTITGSGPVQTLAAVTVSGTAHIDATGKSVTLNSGALLTFKADGTAVTVGKISVAGDLNLNANAITLNITGSALAAGSYRLLDCTGTLANSGTFAAPTITGTALGANKNAYITVTSGAAGHVDLVVNAYPVVVTPIALGAQSNVLQTLTIVGGKFPPTDANGDTLTISAVTQGAHGTVAIANSTDVTFISSTVGADSFTYTVSDGKGGTAVGTVNVAVTAVVNQQTPELSFNGSGNAVLVFWGVPGMTYTIQKSTDLSTWTDLTPTVTANDTSTQPYGQINFTDTGAPSGPAGFYRLKP